MNHRRSAFSLVELLIVVAIIGIIAGFGVPAVQGVLRGSALTQASSQLTDNLALARQHAISRNRTVEVRFYRFGDPEVPGETASDPSSGSFRALQYFEVNETGVSVPIGKYQRFPDTMMMNAGERLSTLLGEQTTLGQRLVTSGEVKNGKNPELPRNVGVNYEGMERIPSCRGMWGSITNTCGFDSIPMERRTCRRWAHRASPRTGGVGTSRCIRSRTPIEPKATRNRRQIFLPG
jgi:uncharacterized protein (TIGR02596 family)